MAMRTRQSQRRRQVLTRERIVETAVELLDAVGEGALTVRALTGRLATGPGAIYWHIGNMDELLEAATDTVVATALAPRTQPAEAAGTPQDEIRAVALGLFDAVTEHAWLAAQLAVQLTRKPWGPVTLRIFEGIGRPVRTLGVPQGDWFTTTSTLVHYILGATTQNSQATGDGSVPGSEADRAEFLDTASRAWRDLDPDDYPFIRAVANQMREHDDREQFLAGIDLVLAGVTALHPPATSSPADS
ncbi:TetR/AcrR family transcriptional regulator [Pseudonocardia cypriaca]|uniref:TetR family transcriptional regulator n=1 Tax=Pseudonocardia cypriaca TaxID=882449 RepID=A0A543GEV6_9PSEU|nr:TetR/AcrR family transcriptional regulator C-terminal domain-containing protein [Pseudonocardia cypriaca]TQM44612.1 TetR family transcriptional regulator [Pseudonocardia cypriaca]